MTSIMPRIVLQIAVERRDQAAPRVGEAGGERRRLAEVPAKADHPHPRVRCLEPGQRVERLIRAPIVHEEDLEGPAPGTERRGQLPVELPDVGRFVVDRDDDGQLERHARGGIIGAEVRQVKTSCCPA
jgi:hypothetical protein